MNAFMVFSLMQRREIIARNPDSHNAEISKVSFPSRLANTACLTRSYISKVDLHKFNLRDFLVGSNHLPPSESWESVEAAGRQGEVKISGGGGDLATSPPEGVSRLQVPAEEKDQVWQRREHDEGEAGEGGGSGQQTDALGGEPHGARFPVQEGASDFCIGVHVSGEPKIHVPKQPSVQVGLGNWSFLSLTISIFSPSEYGMQDLRSSMVPSSPGTVRLKITYFCGVCFMYTALIYRLRDLVRNLFPLLLR